MIWVLYVSIVDTALHKLTDNIVLEDNNTYMANYRNKLQH